MRKKITIIMLTMFALASHAQYYLLTFSGAGAATTIDSIRILNLAQNTTVKLTGTDTLLLAGVVGQEEFIAETFGLHVWPTPSDGYCRVRFQSPISGKARIELFNAAGKSILQEAYNVSSGENSFDLSSLPFGLNILSIQLNGKRLSAKIPVTNKNLGAADLSATGNRPILKKSKAIVVMQYNDNEVLLFKAYSGNYARFQPWIINASQTIYFDFIQCTDLMGNNYPVVRIGSQVWMADNLRTTYFTDGTPIPLVEDNTTWANLTTPAMCWYNNNPAQNGYMGGYYNFYAVENDNICPNGWHVPTKAEFEQMLVFLQQYGYNYNGLIDPDNDPTTNDYTAKSLSSRSLWAISTEAGAPGNTDYPNYRNRTGFESFPYGARSYYTGGTFLGVKSYANYWSKTAHNADNSYRLQLMYNNPSSGVLTISKNMGFNVRCVKN
ncbi:MAG: FISUMP domain-containing protein [Bacteroidales bacterium]